MEKKLIVIPFHGFYESIHSSMIDDAITSYYDPEGTGEPSTMPDDFWIKFNGYHDICQDYAKQYVEHFQDKFNELTGLSIKLTFADLKSPREYNFETDRIFATISPQDAQSLFDFVNQGALSDVIKENFTSYDGFISFYSNDVLEWLAKPFAEWDHNELYTLILAALAQEGQEEDFDFDIVTDMHDTLYQIIDNHIPAEFQPKEQA